MRIMDERSEPRLSAERQAFLVAAGSIAVFLVLLYLTTGSLVPVSSNPSGDLPTHLSNAEFWKLVTDLSEPDGYFHSDNYLSNETGFQEVIPSLRKTVKPGGVYLGVGPEQNFTYIATLQPRLSFIIDIRRQNMIEHLLYKAFMEIASDRADFMSRLFARARPDGVGSGSTAEELFVAFGNVTPRSAFFESNLDMVQRHLEGRGIVLTFDDQKSMRKVYEAFYESGPELSYTFTDSPQRFGRAGMPSYSTLMTATDGYGKNWSYLASESQFRIVQQLEQNNLIVPLVGNFAGDKTLRAVGQYVKDRHASITTFYLSNVEQYLFMDGIAGTFYDNVATFPIDPSSTFIRSTAIGRPGWNRLNRYRSVLRTLTDPIGGMIQAFHNDQIHAYHDVVDRSSPPN